MGRAMNCPTLTDPVATTPVPPGTDCFSVELLRKRLSTCCMDRAMNCPTLTDPVAIAPDVGTRRDSARFGFEPR